MKRRGAASTAVLAGLVMAVAAPLGTGPVVAGNEDGPPVTTPDNFRAEVGMSSVIVQWDASMSDAGVAIYFVKLNGQWFSTEEPTMTFYLHNGTTYRLEVQAQDADHRRSDWSEPFEFTTPNGFAVTTPANVQVKESPGSVTVEWDPSVSDAGVMDYTVQLSGGSIGTVARRVSDTTARFDAPPGGEFAATVRARDTAYRWSDTSDTVEFTLPPAEDWEPPSAPTNLRAFPDGDNIVFEWDAATGGAPPVTYRIYLDGDEIESTRELRLSSPYFAECTSGSQQSATFVLTATSYGFESSPSNAIALCFA